MRVMIIDSGRGHHAELVDSLRDELGLVDSDEVVWLAREVPKEPLPVVSHLVARTRRGVLHRTLRVQTLLDAPGVGVDIDAATLLRAARLKDGEPDEDVSDSAGLATEDELGMPSQQVEELFPESMQEHEHHTATPGASPEAVESGTRPTPLSQRAVHAARWRSNAVRIHARDTVRRGKTSAKRRINSSEATPVVIVRDTVKKALPNVGTKFAYAAATSERVIELASTCDVIFSHDARSHKVAWLLAQRTPNPDVVVGTNAARRAVAARRARTVS